MDRSISRDEQRKAKLKTLSGWLVGIGVVAGAFLLLRGAITPSVERDALRVATVQRGAMIAAIDVAGVIIPRSETVVSAPFPSEVRAIVAFPGTTVSAGDPLLELEFRPLEVEIAEVTEQLALKENERRVRRLVLEKAMAEASGRQELLQIDLESRKAKLDRLLQLSEIGAISKGDLQEARLDVRRTEVELVQLERQLDNQRETHAAELERIDLEASILRNQLGEKQRLRELATVRAPHDGVVTWVQEEAGASVTLGAALARVADLSAFRVEATASDFYAQSLREGQPARVTAAGQVLDGRVSAVLPTVEGGTVRLLIDLEQPDAPGLRPQIRSDVELITDQAQDTLYINRGPGSPGRGPGQLYRIADGVAMRTPVTIGFSNRDHVQVLDGLSEGDEVIVSDTAEFNHLQQIDIE